MITAITPDALKEKSFQALIRDYLISDNGYIESINSGYDKLLAIDVDCLFSFLESTQEKRMNKLKEIYKSNYRDKILNNLDKQLRTRSMGLKTMELSWILFFLSRLLI